MDCVRVLCVENHPEDMATLQSMLEGMGCEVMTATNAGQALNLLAEQPIDGVLLEDDLPGASSMTVRYQMKAMRPDIPVFVFAGISRQTPVMLRFFDAYLRRPERAGSISEELDL